VGAKAPRIRFDTDIQYLKGVGPVRARHLQRLKLERVGDLLHHYPHDYLDRGQQTAMAELRAGMRAVTRGLVLNVESRNTRQRRSMLTVLLGDGPARLRLVWFNAAYLANRFRLREEIFVSGELRAFDGWLQMVNPEFEGEGDRQELSSGRPLPRYPLTAGLRQGNMRHLVSQALEILLPELEDPLPVSLRRSESLLDHAEALRRVHQPESVEDAEQGRVRLAFDEALSLQLAVQQRRTRYLRQHAAVRLGEFGEDSTRFVHSLPFQLSAAQRRILAELAKDLRGERAMHRLLQGDVGSGKTLVAVVAMLWMVESGAQAALMAPTEVLAQQHGRRHAEAFDELGIRSATLTGSTPAAERRAILRDLREGKIQIVFGTHALIQEGVEFQRLGLAVVDEQHRFGVLQRANLAGRGVHLLVMTATPIPRSLALTVFGDLDLSLLDEMPAGRTPVETHLLRPTQLPKAYERVRAAAERGERSYLVFPLVEESESGDVASATSAFEELSSGALSGLRLGLLHGRLPSREKRRVSEAFEAGELDAVVATTVIEVGMDVPEASLMIIHSAERFGLAQLHQLRGRVGRGSAASHCVLVESDEIGPHGRERLKLVVGCSDGFRLAEEDMKRRGIGELYGTRQHGELPFVLLKPLQDEQILRRAREIAREILERDPKLSGASNRPLRRWLDALGHRNPFWSSSG
jgi:ATP-dependent DNA helicase RecG